MANFKKLFSILTSLLFSYLIITQNFYPVIAISNQHSEIQTPHSALYTQHLTLGSDITPSITEESLKLAIIPNNEFESTINDEIFYETTLEEFNSVSRYDAKNIIVIAAYPCLPCIGICATTPLACAACIATQCSSSGSSSSSSGSSSSGDCFTVVPSIRALPGTAAAEITTSKELSNILQDLIYRINKERKKVVISKYLTIKKKSPKSKIIKVTGLRSGIVYAEVELSSRLAKYIEEIKIGRDEKTIYIKVKEKASLNKLKGQRIEIGKSKWILFSVKVETCDSSGGSSSGDGSSSGGSSSGGSSSGDGSSSGGSSSGGSSSGGSSSGGSSSGGSSSGGSSSGGACISEDCPDFPCRVCSNGVCVLNDQYPPDPPIDPNNPPCEICCPCLIGASSTPTAHIFGRDDISKAVQKAFTKEYVKIQKNKKARKYNVINKVEPTLDEIKISPIKEKGIEEVTIDQKTKEISVRVAKDGKTSWIKYRAPSCDVMCNWTTPPYDPVAANVWCETMYAMNENIAGMPVPDNKFCKVDYDMCLGGCCVECRDDIPPPVPIPTPPNPGSPFNPPPFLNGDLDCNRYVEAIDGPDSPTTQCKRINCNNNVCGRTTYDYCKKANDGTTNLNPKKYCNGNGLCTECDPASEPVDMQCQAIYGNAKPFCFINNSLPVASGPHWKCSACQELDNMVNFCMVGANWFTCNLMGCYMAGDIPVKPVCKDDNCVECLDGENMIIFDMNHNNVCSEINLMTPACWNNMCYECIISMDCPAAKPVCNTLMVCVECDPTVNDPETGINPDCMNPTPSCRPDTMTCVECTQDKGCGLVVDMATCTRKLCATPTMAVPVPNNPGLYMCSAMALEFCGMNGRNPGKVCDKVFLMGDCVSCNIGQECPVPPNTFYYQSRSIGQCIYTDPGMAGQPYTRNCGSNFRCGSEYFFVSTGWGSCVNKACIDMAFMDNYPNLPLMPLPDFNGAYTAINACCNMHCMDFPDSFGMVTIDSSAIAIVPAELMDLGMILMNYGLPAIPVASRWISLGMDPGNVPGYNVEYCKATCKCIAKHNFINNLLPIFRPAGWSIPLANMQAANTYSCLLSMCMLTGAGMMGPGMEDCPMAGALQVSDFCLMNHCPFNP